MKRHTNIQALKTPDQSKSHECCLQFILLDYMQIFTPIIILDKSLGIEMIVCLPNYIVMVTVQPLPIHVAIITHKQQHVKGQLWSI
jgi:hypothetical protein